MHFPPRQRLRVLILLSLGMLVGVSTGCGVFMELPEFESSDDCAGSCGAGQVCTDGMCVEQACTSGEPGCACLEGEVCAPGSRCRMGVCVTCTPSGELD